MSNFKPTYPQSTDSGADISSPAVGNTAQAIEEGKAAASKLETSQQQLESEQAQFEETGFTPITGVKPSTVTNPKDPLKNGKTKIIVDDSAFMNIPRDPKEPEKYDPNSSRQFFGIQDLTDVAPESSGKDRLRAALGKNWDLSSTSVFSNISQTYAGSATRFYNNWKPIAVFHNEPLQLLDCGNDEYNENTHTYRQKVVLSCVLPANLTSFNEPEMQVLSMPGLIIEQGGPSLFNWINFVKTGIQNFSGQTLPPLVRAEKDYFDHYHEVKKHFSPAEQEVNATPNILTVNYKNYYNERINSAQFETYAGSRPSIHNSLPSVYSFVRLFQDTVSGNQFLESIFNTFFHYYGKTNAASYSKITRHMLENPAEPRNILYLYAFEVLASLYGTIGQLDYDIVRTTKQEKASSILQKIINAPYNSGDNFNPYTPRPAGSAIDLDGYFESYFDEYVFRLTNDIDFNKPLADNLKIQHLEKTFSNLLFDADFVKSMNLVNKYKNYFPFYNEIEFSTTASPVDPEAANSVAGDSGILNLITSYNATTKFAYYMLDSLTQSRKEKFASSINTSAKSQNFDRSGEQIFMTQGDFVDLNVDNIELTPGATATKQLVRQVIPNKKNIFDLIQLSDNIKYKAQNPAQRVVSDFDASSSDIRNFVAQLREEKVDIGVEDEDRFFTAPDDDFSSLFQELLNDAFVEQLYKLYDDKYKRSWLDIMNGVPAHAEDLYYRIEKVLVNEDDTEDVLQNILIPNNQNMGEVKFVDTQVKYRTYAKYRYKVYALRAVFGSKYKYRWGVEQNGAFTPLSEENSTYPPYIATAGPEGQENSGILNLLNDNILQLGTQAAVFTEPNQQGVSYARNYSFAVHAETTPSIKIIEDLLFETPIMSIIDKPPVPPQVSIIPYRAKSDQIKILLDGSVDRFRDFPIAITDDDETEFNEMIEAQLSYDNKIEFGSDDPITSFQIFRVKEHPRTFKDFQLHKTVSGNAVEDTLSPNTKYFYTFRAVDTHGHVSNPTEIFEVELIDEAGAVKPKIRPVGLFKEDSDDQVKEVQKYIMIKPSQLQLFFSDNPSVNSIFSSDDADANKKKKFKIRMTSKSTGKKIDVNIAFNKKIKND